MDPMNEAMPSETPESHDENEMSVSEDGKEFTAALPKKILGEKFGKVQEGDEITLKVVNVGGDTITVSMAAEPEQPKVMSDDEMKAMKPEDVHKMPLNQLEASLPMADRG